MPMEQESRWTFRLLLIFNIALLSLSDAVPDVSAGQVPVEDSPKKTDPGLANNRDGKADSYTLRGRCFDRISGSAVPGILVKLYVVRGQTSAPDVVAFTISDENGEFEFKDLEAPRPEQRIDRLEYGVFAFDNARPIGIGFRDQEAWAGKAKYEIAMGREATTLSGKVIDERGKPVAGATVMQFSLGGFAVEGILSATTDADGKFEIEKVTVYRDRAGANRGIHFRVVHPDFPATTGETNLLPPEVTVTLPTGCIVTGKVIDRATGQAVAGAIVSAHRIDPHSSDQTVTTADGQFRLALREGRYNFTVEAKDLVCAAVTDHECLTGQSVNLPPFEMVEGGFISGRVINTATGQVVTVTDAGNSITIGLTGPSLPRAKVISPLPLAAVDETGHFVVRAFPGENFPYFVNIHGHRMAWDTCNQPPVVVKAGETTAFDMLITPPLSPDEKMKAARDVIEALPKEPANRAAQIIEQFRRVPGDDTELWCMLMRELVTLGRNAVPPLCEELDRTTENRMLRRIGFALRAIGDPRAVPALIRAIPRTLLPSSSDYGLIVADPALTDFMQQHDLDERKGGMYFSLGRPVREIYGAIHKLTQRNFDDIELFSISLSEDPRRQVLQRRLVASQAQRWQTWWEANWRDFTDDDAYQHVKLIVVDEELPPAPTKLGPNARLGGGIRGATASPAIQGGQHAKHFYDLDTEYEPKWPAHIPRDESQIDQRQLVDWATEKGVDLMCVTHRSADGKETFVLRAIGMKVTEISPRDLRNIDKLIAAGTLPEGRTVDELLMHYDASSQKSVPDANAAFIFVTREGSMGLIKITDRITRTANLTGLAGNPPAGVGFFLGVRFDLTQIIP